MIPSMTPLLNGWTIPLTLSYLSKINNVLLPQRVSPPLKKWRDMFSEGNAAHTVRSDSRYSIVKYSIDSLAPIFKFELAGFGLAACCWI